MSEQQRKLCGGCKCSSSGDCVKTVYRNGAPFVTGCNYSNIVCESCKGCKNFKPPANWEDTHTYIKTSQEITEQAKAQTTSAAPLTLKLKQGQVDCSEHHNNPLTCGSYANCNYCKIRDENKCVSDRMKGNLEILGEIDQYSCFPKNYYVKDPTKTSDADGLNSFDYMSYLARKNKQTDETGMSSEEKQQKETNERKQDNGNDDASFTFINNVSETTNNKPLKYDYGKKVFYDETMNSSLTYVDEEEVAPEKDVEQVAPKKELDNVETEELLPLIEDISAKIKENKNSKLILFILLVVCVILFYAVLAYIYAKYK